jgi:hypothetical protein
LISRRTARLWLLRASRSEGSAAPRPTEPGSAATPGRDIPPDVAPDSLLARLITLAQAAEEVEQGWPALEKPRPVRPDMDVVWSAYTDVINVLGAITRSARLVELGVCPASQLAAIDLLTIDLDKAWTRWDRAHRKVIGEQSRRHEP